MHPFSVICEELAKYPSKLKKVEITSNYLKDLDDKSLYLSCLFFTGTPFSTREKKVISIGGQMIKKALAQSVNMLDENDSKKIDEISLHFSEPGEMVEYVLKTFGYGKKDSDPLKDLELAEKFFLTLFETSGSIAKVDLLANYYKEAEPLSAKYITKILANDLRIGLKEASVEESIAKAFERPVSDVKNANMLIGDIGEVALKAKHNELQNAKLTPFLPVKAMLATAAEDSNEIIDRMGEELWVEDKYDGIRAQIHKFGDEVKLFSRDQNEITSQFPEIVRYISKIPHNLILDGEVMAFRNNEIMRFFFLQKRLGRKKISEEMLNEIPVEYFVYDLLYLDDEVLLDKTLKERRELCENLLGKTNTKYNNTNYEGIHLSHHEEVKGFNELEQAFNSAKERVTEGLMIKTPNSTYKPGKRGIDWLKYKKALEPLDVVITGVEYGHGKRRNQLSDYTFAVRDHNELVNIGKAYSGVTDEEIKMLTERFLKDTIEVFGRFRTVKPEVVLEIMFESIQKSSRHKSGFALRFPRITKIRIGDKGVNDISTLKDVEKLYKKHFEKEETES